MNLHTYLGPCTSTLSPYPSTPTSHCSYTLLGTHKWVGYSPMGLAFGADRVVEDATTSRVSLSRLVEFEIPLDSDPIRKNHFSAGLIKSRKFCK